MAETIRCPLSDMPPEWCAHCRGDNPAVSGDSFVAVPLSLRAFRPRYITPLDTPPPVSVLPPLWRDVVTHAYPLLCARGELCRASEHGGPRQTGQRAWLCPPCEDHTRDDLLALAGIWVDLEAALTAPPPRDDDGLPGGRSEPSTGLNLNEAASAALSEATALALLYARLARTETGRTPGETRRHRDGRPYIDVTTPSLLRWLARNTVPSFAAHPDQGLALAFADDAHRLWRAGHSAAYPQGWRTLRIPLDCARRDDGHLDPDVLADMDATDRDSLIAAQPPCPGRMTARVKPDLDRLPDLVCDQNPAHTVPPATWQRLGWKANARSERGLKALLERTKR